MKQQLEKSFKIFLVLGTAFSTFVHAPVAIGKVSTPAQFIAAISLELFRGKLSYTK